MITLRKITPADAPTLLRWGQDSYYHQTAGFEQLTTIAAAVKSAQMYADRPDSFAICLDEQMIGLIELYERGLDQASGLLNTKDLGFLLDKAYQHQGYMTSAIKLIETYAFVDLSQVELWAHTFIDNLPSQKLLEKLGFEEKYIVDNQLIFGQEFKAEKYYLLSKQQWIKINDKCRS